MNAPDTAGEYIQKGWSVVVVRARQKRPLHDDWPKIRITADRVREYFKPDSNIGVVLGDVSKGLVDVDLDCPEAIALAPHFLPDTVEFGRASSRRSHRLYYAPSARTEKFQQPLGAGKTKMLVELRANKASEDGEGLQTVFPGSVHETGELIEWEPGLADIARCKPEQLRQGVARVAAGALLMRTGWDLARARAFGEKPAAGAIAELPDASYAPLARWLGLPRRQQERRTPPPLADNRLKRAAAYLARIDGAVAGAGGHQQAWAAALAVVRGFDLDEVDAYNLLARDFNPRCDPPWSERELRHKVETAARAGRAERGWLLNAERPQSNGASSSPTRSSSAPAADPGPPPEWEPPIEFDVFDLPPFPVDVFPSAIGDFVAALARSTQTPVDLAAMLALSACAASCAKRLVVEIRPGYREPVNLFTVVVLPSGERKSAVMKDISAPLIAWEARAAEDVAPALARAAQQYAMSKKRLDAATDRAAKAKKREEREQLEMEALDLSEQHAKLEMPKEPRILADDATPEALTSLLAQHGGRIAIFSAEGGVFSQMAGKYSNSPSLDVYLKAHAGDEIRVDRMGRPSERISDPALTLGLAVQPSVLEALQEQPMLRGTGLLARFLYAMPTSMLGSRRQDAPPIPEAVRAAYDGALRRLLLLQAAPKPIVLKLSPEAYLAWCEFSAWLEPQLGEFGELRSISDWAGKLAGAVARIAGLMAILRILSTDSLKLHSEDHIISIYIDRGEMVRSISLGRYLVPHAGSAISSMGANPDHNAAKHILRWMEERALQSFTRREVQQSTRRATAFDEPARLDRALDLLTDNGFLRKVSEPPKGPGRPSIRFEVNPLWAVRYTESGTQYPQNPPSNPSFLTKIEVTQNHGSLGREREPGEDDE